MCADRELTSIPKKQDKRWRVTAQSTASIVDAWVRKNCRHVESVFRCGAGGTRRAVRTRRIVEALTWWLRLSSSVWILLSPQERFSVARRLISVAISVLTGGRPVRAGAE
jgi:hypothetical protein